MYNGINGPRHICLVVALHRLCGVKSAQTHYHVSCKESKPLSVDRNIHEPPGPRRQFSYCPKKMAQVTGIYVCIESLAIVPSTATHLNCYSTVALPVKSKDKYLSSSSRASLFSMLRTSAASVPPQRSLLSSIRGRGGGAVSTVVQSTNEFLRPSVSYPGRHPSLTNRASQSFLCSGQ